MSISFPVFPIKNKNQNFGRASAYPHGNIWFGSNSLTQANVPLMGRGDTVQAYVGDVRRQTKVRTRLLQVEEDLVG